MPCPYDDIWVFPVEFPFQGIIHYIFPDIAQFAFVADDVLIIISLPEFHAGFITSFVDSFGSRGFK